MQSRNNLGNILLISVNTHITGLTNKEQHFSCNTFNEIIYKKNICVNINSTE